MSGQSLVRFAALIALLVPGITGMSVALNWQRHGMSPITGDEPHYLIIADAIGHDHRLSVGTA